MSDMAVQPCMEGISIKKYSNLPVELPSFYAFCLQNSSWLVIYLSYHLWFLVTPLKIGIYFKDQPPKKKTCLRFFKKCFCFMKAFIFLVLTSNDNKTYYLKYFRMLKHNQRLWVLFLLLFIKYYNI